MSAEIVTKKSMIVSLNGRIYRYMELIEEVKPSSVDGDIIDLTSDQEPEPIDLTMDDEAIDLTEEPKETSERATSPNVTSSESNYERATLSNITSSESPYVPQSPEFWPQSPEYGYSMYSPTYEPADE